MFDNFTFPIPCRVHQTDRLLVPVKLARSQLGGGRVSCLHQRSNCDDVINVVVANQDDLFESLHLLLQIQTLINVERVADKDRGGRLLQLLLESLGVGETVDGEDYAAELPDCQAHLVTRVLECLET